MHGRERVLGLVRRTSPRTASSRPGSRWVLGPLAWVALIPLLVVVLVTQPTGSVGLAVRPGVRPRVLRASSSSWIFLFGWMAWTALTDLPLACTSARDARRRRSSATSRSRRCSSPERGRGRARCATAWPYGGYSVGLGRDDASQRSGRAVARRCRRRVRADVPRRLRLGADRDAASSNGALPWTQRRGGRRRRRGLRRGGRRR